MLEEKLDRIAVALEKLCALMAEMPKVETKAPATREKKEPVKKETPAPVTEATKPVAEAPKVPEAPKPEPTKPVEAPKTPETAPPVAPITVEQLRASIIEVQQKKGPVVAKKIVQEIGNAPQVTKIEVSKYQMVMDACKAALL